MDEIIFSRDVFSLSQKRTIKGCDGAALHFPQLSTLIGDEMYLLVPLTPGGSANYLIGLTVGDGMIVDSSSRFTEILFQGKVDKTEILLFSNLIACYIIIFELC